MDDIKTLIKEFKKDLKEDLSKISNKVDNLDSRLDEVDKTLIKQEGNLQEHMRRTAIAEQRIDLIHKETEPIKLHVDRVQFVFKAIKWVGLPVLFSSLIYLVNLFISSLS